MLDNIKNKNFFKSDLGKLNIFLRTTIFIQLFIFPFFVRWFYKNNLNIFSSFIHFIHFLLSSMFGIACVILWNSNIKILKDKERKQLHWYDPRMSLLIPAWYGGGHGLFGPESLTDPSYYIKWISCDLLWFLLVSPLLIFYFFYKMSATKKT